MSIRNRLIPVFAILLAGLLLRLLRTHYGLEWAGWQRVLYLIGLSGVLTVLARAVFRLTDRRNMR